MGYIYKISNSINDKLYIGKTCTTLSNRWSHHISDYTKYDWHLYRAMRKYGIENFSIELVEECEDNKLNEQEQYWINYYNSYNNGYNMTLGGEGASGNNYHTKEFKQRLSERMKTNNPAYNMTDEWRQHIGDSQRGKKRSDEFKQQRSEKMKQNNPMKNPDVVAKRKATLLKKKL